MTKDKPLIIIPQKSYSLSFHVCKENKYIYINWVDNEGLDPDLSIDLNKYQLKILIDELELALEMIE